MSIESISSHLIKQTDSLLFRASNWCLVIAQVFCQLDVNRLGAENYSFDSKEIKFSTKTIEIEFIKNLRKKRNPRLNLESFSSPDLDQKLCFQNHQQKYF